MVAVNISLLRFSIKDMILQFHLKVPTVCVVAVRLHAVFNWLDGQRQEKHNASSWHITSL